MVNAEKFRNIFLSYLNNKTSKKDYFIFLPDEKLLESTAETPNNFLETLKEKLKKTPPSYLYKLGHKSQTKSFDVNDLLKTLQHRPITFVIFPGFMSEFIETKTLQEVFRENLEFGEDFYQSELKDKNNNILIKYLLFKTPPMSFATIGDTRENAMDFIERLERFFSVNGVPENIVFLGYSRGTMIALDVLALFMQRKSPWLKNIKGMVSLGGVVFGSDLVDEVFRSPADREILLLKELGNKLKIPKNLETLSVSNTPLKKYFWEWVTKKRVISKDDILILKQNAQAWYSFAKEIKQSPLDWSLFEIMLSGFKRGEETHHKENLKLLIKILGQEFGLKNFFSDHSKNIIRFKDFINKLAISLEQMTTQKRLQWWQTNEVPTQGIRYYSVVSVFVDPLDSKRLSKHSPPYNQKLLDYKFSLRNYRHLRKISQVKLNDSQMTFEKAIFLPELIKLLNPKQPPLSTCLLGVLGTHHWGMAIPIVMKMKDGSLDPFPREILLKSIATSIAIDLQ